VYTSLLSSGHYAALLPVEDKHRLLILGRLLSIGELCKKTINLDSFSILYLSCSVSQRKYSYPSSAFQIILINVCRI
jgi:hypothetical protein